jgi:hypothetical protein
MSCEQPIFVNEILWVRKQLPQCAEMFFLGQALAEKRVLAERHV